jgi:hypothetical protein
VVMPLKEEKSMPVVPPTEVSAKAKRRTFTAKEKLRSTRSLNRMGVDPVLTNHRPKLLGNSECRLGAGDRVAGKGRAFQG